jgi:hypothetical protein
MMTKRQATLDVSVVGGCSGAYMVASLLRVPIGWNIPVVVGVLVGYWLFVLRRRSDTWRDYGLRSDNLAAEHGELDAGPLWPPESFCGGRTIRAERSCGRNW